MNNKLTFTWDIHLSCSYRCPYCWFHGNWEEVGKKNRYLSPDELFKYWKRIKDNNGRAMITIAGGEPLIYPDMIEVLDKLSEIHDIEITSNLSSDYEFLEELTKRLGGRNIRISATFHPLFAKLQEYLPKVLKLREAGLLGGCLFLAYPPQIERISEVKKLLSEHNLPFSVLTFWGKYNGKNYPESYTDEEKKIIGLSIGSRGGENFQTAPKSTLGLLCNAGHTYAVIHPDGEVLRCGGAGVRGKPERVGNFFSEDFALLEGPAPCPSENCPCNEWAFLLIDRNSDG